jgi:hypothetical protein
VEAARWPQWYAPVHDVRLLSGSCVLDHGSTFAYKMHGEHIDAVVREFLPYSRLSWLATSTDTATYHAWLLRTIPDGCYVIALEAANGRDGRAGHKPDLRSAGQVPNPWLSALKERSET